MSALPDPASDDHRDDEVEESDLEAPEPIFVNRRFIKPGIVAWARQADEIMLEHGFVFGTSVYPKRHQARWRARKLIDVMVRLEMYERWELEEHVNRRGDGWLWSVEHKVRGTSV